MCCSKRNETDIALMNIKYDDSVKLPDKLLRNVVQDLSDKVSH